MTLSDLAALVERVNAAPGRWLAGGGTGDDIAVVADVMSAAPALIRVAKAAREWRAAYLADGDDEEPPFITKLDIAAGELCDAVRALKGEG